MMAELEILSTLQMRFRLTIKSWENVIPGTRNVVYRPKSFKINGGKFRLAYYYTEGENEEERLQLHVLSLSKRLKSRGHPVDVCVQVEGGGRGQIVSDLSQHTFFDNVNRFVPSYGKAIWKKEEFEIQQAAPNFRNHGLTFIIVLKDGILQAASAASQTKCSIPEDFEMSCMESLSTDFAQLMARGSDHDLTFMCEGQPIGAHGAVVCARSSVFAAMLRSDMVEGRTREIRIPGVELGVFKRFLRYLYYGKLDELTCDDAIALYELGDQYAVLGLVKGCSQFLLEHLSPDNACDILFIADLHTDEDFAKKIITYMVEATVLDVSDRWPAFRENHPKLAIKVLCENELTQEKKRRCQRKKFSFTCYQCGECKRMI